MMDRIMAMAGIQNEPAEARARAVVARESREPADVNAVRIADAFRDRSDMEIRRLLPDVGTEALPRQADLRWEAIARATHKTIRHHYEKGDDHALGPDLGAAVRWDTAARALAQSLSLHAPGDQPLSEVLDDISKRSSRQVRNFLSLGEAVDEATGRRASMPRNTRWGGQKDVTAHVVPYMGYAEGQERSTFAEMMVERAMARAGVLPAYEILTASREMAAYGGLEGDHSREGGYRRPDLANAKLPEAERRALVDNQIRTLRGEQMSRTQPAQAVEAPAIRNPGMAAMIAQQAGRGV